MHIELSILLTIIFGTFTTFAYLANILAKGVSCLTALKKDVESIKNNQDQIIRDVERIEKKVFE